METCSNSFSKFLSVWMLLSMALASVALGGSSAAAQSWNLPVDVSDKNAKAGFEVDSTWHLIHGTTKNLSGRVWLENENDPSSVRGRIVIPVSAFDTDNSSRDSRLREGLQADKYAEVTVDILSLASGCSPAALESRPECHSTVHARLSIRGVVREVTLPILIKRSGERYDVTGEVKIRWSDFGVEDPSILVARLAKEVKIDFGLALSKPANEAHS